VRVRLIESLRDLGMAFAALVVPLLIGLDGDKFAFVGIALLYSVTRTATVAATTETTLLRVGREAFLTAMRAHPSVSAAAEMLARKRLGESG
jgi:CRP-like cAMP-binding protein